jgi:hypothetical protein
VSHESISKAASTATYTGASLSVSSAAAQSVIPPGAQDVVLGLTLNQWTVAGIFFGMLMALAGWLTNLYFKQAHLKLAEARMNEVAPDGD